MCVTLFHLACVIGLCMSTVCHCFMWKKDCAFACRTKRRLSFTLEQTHSEMLTCILLLKGASRGRYP